MNNKPIVFKEFYNGIAEGIDYYQPHNDNDNFCLATTPKSGFYYDNWYRNWHCTRPRGHEGGVHAAHIGLIEYAIWGEFDAFIEVELKYASIR